MIFLVYCIASLFKCMFVLFPSPTGYFHTPMARYNLFLLKVALNSNKPS